MNKFFMGLFTALTVIAGINSTDTHPVSKGDDVNNLAHEAALKSVTQAAMASRSVRVGSAGYSSGSYSRGGSSGGSYRGGK